MAVNQQRPGPLPEVPPEPMPYNVKSRVRAAAFRATRLYPGPVGDCISRELLTWDEFGYQLAGHGSIMRLVDFLLKTPAS